MMMIRIMLFLALGHHHLFATIHCTLALALKVFILITTKKTNMKKSAKKSSTKKKDQDVFLMESVVLNSTKLKIPHTIVAAFLIIKVSQIVVSTINIGALLIITAFFMRFLAGSGLLSLETPSMSRLVYSPSLPLYYPRVGFFVFVGFPVFTILQG